MYKLLLILKYLRKRRIAWVSLAAVMLCTTMVLVVISVMGGWLREFRRSFHGVSGDVLVNAKSMVGFTHYEEMIKRLNELPEVKAAAPVIRTYGLVNINNQIRRGVEVVGYPPDIQDVNGFRRSLYLMGGHVSGYLVDGQQAGELAKRPEKGKYLVAALRAKPPAPDVNAKAFSVVTENGILPLDASGNVRAKVYLEKLYAQLKGAAVPEARIRTEGEAEVAAKNKRGELEVRSISRGDQLNFDLWPEVFPGEFYLPPSNYTGRDVRTWKGAIVGDGVIGLKKDKDGKIPHPWYIYRAFVDLTVLPMSPEGMKGNLATDRARDFFWIVDDSRLKVFIYDSNTIYLPFASLQELLQMDEQEGRPARTTDIQISLKPGYDARALKAKIKATVDSSAFETKLVDKEARDRLQAGLEKATAEVEAFEKRDKSAFTAADRQMYEELKRNKESYEQSLDSLFPYKVQSWEEVHGTFLGAVEKEKGLMTILFGMISVVAVFLIFCIFYMIVVEKTRDIGIIKSVGATSGGVAGIFLGYGLAIGLVGAGAGLGLGWLIVHYINEIHSWLGRFGVVVWNPEVYLFDEIPATMIVGETAVILGVAVIASVIGALVPAIRAARMHPVEALRWE